MSSQLQPFQPTGTTWPEVIASQQRTIDALRVQLEDFNTLVVAQGRVIERLCEALGYDDTVSTARLCVEEELEQGRKVKP